MITGLLLLLALLLAAGLAGGIGAVELGIWLVLVLAWVAYGIVRRARRPRSPVT